MANEVQRVIIPSEFYEITSPQLLTAPIPQFPHAKLVISALNAALSDAGDSMAMPFRDVPKGMIDEYAALKDLELMMSNPLPKEAIQVINDWSPAARSPGHVVKFNRPRFVDTTHTALSRTVAAGTLIGTAPVAILGDQVPVAIKRFVGPYNGTTGAPGPFAMDIFDSNFALHDFVKIVDAHFKYDYHKSVDTWAIQLFDQAPTANIIYAGGATANDDMSAENSHPFDWRLLKRTARRMDDANVPRMSDGKRIVCITPLQEEQLTTDPEYQRLAKTRDDMNPLFKDSYVTGIMDWHIFKSNTLTRSTNGSSVSVHYAQAFGPGAVGWGLGGGTPKIHPNSNDNFGQTIFAVWIALMGFGVLNENFLYSLRSS